MSGVVHAGQPVLADGQHRPRGLVGEDRARDPPADPGAAHARDDQPAGRCPAARGPADSAFQTASRSCSGSASTSASWPPGSSRSSVAASRVASWCSLVCIAAEVCRTRSAGGGARRKDARPARAPCPPRPRRPRRGRRRGDRGARADARTPGPRIESCTRAPSPIARSVEQRPSARRPLPRSITTPARAPSPGRRPRPRRFCTPSPSSAGAAHLAGDVAALADRYARRVEPRAGLGPRRAPERMSAVPCR